MASNIDKFIANKKDGIVGVILRDINKVFLVDYIDNKLFRSFDVFNDTAQRIAFSNELDVIIIGSWRKGMICRSIQTSEVLWTSKINEFTNLDILEETKLLIISNRDGDSIVLNIRDGSFYQNIKERSLVMSNSHVLSVSPTQLNLYDKQLKLITSASWNCWAVDCFDFDNDNNVIASDPDAICRFKIGGQSKAQGLKAEFERLRCIAWNDRHDCFFAVARFYKGVPGVSLIRFNSDLCDCELIMKLEGVGHSRFVNNAKYLICDNGLLFDLDELRVLDMIDWSAIINC